MKKTISLLSIVFTVSILSLNAQCCNTPTAGCNGAKKSVNAQVAADVQAYYFHATRRCATCQAVESVTKDALKEYYGNDVVFHSLNIEEDKNDALIEKLKISGQTLLIIKGDKTVNLTNDAFMNARTNPDKFKAKIKATVDAMI